jgi:ubiquinone/menaquinone biosynthesis C-methylase UbiE
MRAYYEDLWERLPEQLTPPELELRTRLRTEELEPEDRVLDLGCGAGVFTAIAAKVVGPARVLGVDVAEAALTRARHHHPELNFELVPFDGPLPLADNCFDVIWASEVIEHVADTATWLSEVRRVLTPQGRLLLTTPSHGRLRLLVHGIERYSEPQGDHLHLYTARSLRTLLTEDFGFREVRVAAATGPPLLRRTLRARALR